jgi:ribonucleoside-diphosphate reductase alpha chain
MAESRVSEAIDVTSRVSTDRRTNPRPPLNVRAVVKRDGREAEPDPGRIDHAIEMAFRAEIGCPFPDPLRLSVAVQIESIADAVIEEINRQRGVHEVVHVEAIQDEVERQLMAAGVYAVARRFIVYREARSRRRENLHLSIRDNKGQEILLNGALLRSWIEVR